MSLTFEDRVRDLLRDHDRDPVRFVDEVRVLKGFVEKKASELHASLEERGVLPTGRPLPDEEVVQRALLRAADAVEALGPESAAEYVDWLLRLLSARGAEGA